MTELGVASPSRLLRETGEPIWQRALGHPMVGEIGAGTLPRDKFRYYFEQNLLYLTDYARAIALAIAKAPDEQALTLLTRFLAEILDHEIPANRLFFERLGGDPKSVEVTAMSETTVGYTRHLLHVAAQGTCAEGLAAILPCQWTYGELGRELAKDPPSESLYSDWIWLFADPEYEALVAGITGLFDRLAYGRDEEGMRELTWIFALSTRYEVLFWDMAYTGRRWEA